MLVVVLSIRTATACDSTKSSHGTWRRCSHTHPVIHPMSFMSGGRMQRKANRLPLLLLWWVALQSWSRRYKAEMMSSIISSKNWPLRCKTSSRILDRAATSTSSGLCVIYHAPKPHQSLSTSTNSTDQLRLAIPTPEHGGDGLIKSIHGSQIPFLLDQIIKYRWCVLPHHACMV